MLAPAARGQFERATQQATFSHARSRAERERRLQRGDAEHRSAPDVRRTPNLSEEKRIAAQRIARDVVHRAEAVIAIGLGYLSLERSTPTLSPGELQRLRLVTQVHSNLFGVVYVLDEPTAGLHPADSLALMAALDHLKAAGNSLFVVEHDLDVMRRADWLVDVGPEAGEKGGRVLYSGPPDGSARSGHLAYRALPIRERPGRAHRSASGAQAGRLAHAGRCPLQQPGRAGGALPDPCADGCDGRLRQRQVQPG